jgi:hypothetical protein
VELFIVVRRGGDSWGRLLTLLVNGGGGFRGFRFGFGRWKKKKGEWK